MSESAVRHLERFQHLASAGAASRGLEVEPLCDYGWLIKPRHALIGLPAGKDIGLTLMAVTHGNETAGLAVVNEVLTHLLSGYQFLSVPVALILGNPAAAKEGLRFIGRDLNRSFGAASASSGAEPALELKRASELAPILARSAYFLDLHQTSRPSERPFLSFPTRAMAIALHAVLRRG